MTKLQSIEARQRNYRVRDLMFAAFVALLAVMGATTVSTTCLGSSTTHVAQR
ncbi:MAG TPA: hypothetical protein VFQ53_23105 [Kofleriaceae bacterium]|nr:hypothetical protein [Kofleriaceae bacterium]